MAQRAIRPGSHRGSPTRPHSLRLADDMWEKAKARAEADGVPMNYVVEQFLNGYAEGLLNLPTVTVEFSTADNT